MCPRMVIVSGLLRVSHVTTGSPCRDACMQASHNDVVNDPIIVTVGFFLTTYRNSSLNLKVKYKSKFEGIPLKGIWNLKSNGSDYHYVGGLLWSPAIGPVRDPLWAPLGVCI